MYNDMDQVLSSGISVIIPCYNVQAYVRRAVASAVAQTLPPEEIICIDDGSTDDTLAILRELEAEHPDLVRVLTGPNTGAAAARNRGLTVAQSTFIQFLDADDELDPNKFSMQVELAGRNKADLVAGTYRYRHTDRQVETRVAEPGNPWVRLLQKRMGITSSNLWRRSTVVAVGGWDEGLASSQEADLMARMLKEGAIVAFDPDPPNDGSRPGGIDQSRVYGTQPRALRQGSGRGASPLRGAWVAGGTGAGGCPGGRLNQRKDSS